MSSLRPNPPIRGPIHPPLYTYARNVDVPEISLVRCSHSFDFLYAGQQLLRKYTPALSWSILYQFRVHYQFDSPHVAAINVQACTQGARSIRPKFTEISVQNSINRFGPTGQGSKKLVHLFRWNTFPGWTGRNCGWMDRAQDLQEPIPRKSR